MEICQFVLMEQLQGDLVEDSVMMEVNLYAQMETALYVQMEQKLPPVLMGPGLSVWMIPDLLVRIVQALSHGAGSNLFAAMVEFLLVLMEVTSPVQDVLMKQSQYVLMELLSPHVLIETNQFVKMEVGLKNHLVRMEIDLHVPMAQAL